MMWQVTVATLTGHCNSAMTMILPTFILRSLPAAWVRKITVRAIERILACCFTIRLVSWGCDSFWWQPTPYQVSGSWTSIVNHLYSNSAMPASLLWRCLSDLLACTGREGRCELYCAALLEASGRRYTNRRTCAMGHWAILLLDWHVALGKCPHTWRTLYGACVSSA